MNAPVWVLPESVHALHEQLLAAFGGATGIRDQGLLASALMRPENRFAYAEPSLFELAAAYAFGLAKNHPFVDGNKRIGFAVAILFLEINGCAFHAAEADATIRMLALAAGEMSEASFARWLEANARRVGRRRVRRRAGR